MVDIEEIQEMKELGVVKRKTEAASWEYEYSFRVPCKFCGEKVEWCFCAENLEDVKKVLAALNFESDSEVRHLTKQAEAIGLRLEGAWSIDFCMAATGNWVFIDAALARDSYYPPECAHAKDWKRLYG